jgi:lysyl-tRNA synthetase class 2
VYAADRDPPSQWGLSARYAVVRVLTVSGLFDLPGIQVPGWTDLTINVLSVALMLAVLLAFFRAPRGRARLGPSDEARLRTLLRAYGGRDAFGWFALRRDRSVCWAPDGSAAIVYRVVNGVALASGDPLGPRPAWPAAVSHWLALTRRHAWVPAVPYAGPAGAVVYEAAGFRVVASGEEAVVEVAAFTAAFEASEGESGLAGVRRLVGAAGYTVRVRREGEVPGEEWERLALLADAWRREGVRWGAGVELGRLGDPADSEGVVAECLDPRGRTCALLRFVPWGTEGLTLDLVRHDRESGRAPVDFLLTEVLLRASAHAAPLAAITRVSLNLRVRRPPLIPRLRPSPTDPFASFTAFAPRRRPRYLLFERRAELPRVLLATTLAEGSPSRPRFRHHAAARGPLSTD